NRWEGFFIGAGPAVSIGIGGKSKLESHYDDGHSSKSTVAVSFGGSKDDEFRLFEFSGNAVTGYNFRNGVFAAFNYNYGLSNLVQGSLASEGKITTSYFALRLGYSFYA